MPAAAVDAQQATSERARALVQHGASVPDQAWMAPRMACRARRARSAVLAIVRAGRKDWALKVGASEHGWMGGAMCMPRGRGRPSRPVASSQAREDCTRPPCWRAIARIVLSRRGQLVSRFGQKKGKSTTCEPSTLRRSVGSRPTRGSHRRKKIIIRSLIRFLREFLGSPKQLSRPPGRWAGAPSATGSGGRAEAHAPLWLPCTAPVGFRLVRW